MRLGGTSLNACVLLDKKSKEKSQGQVRLVRLMRWWRRGMGNPGATGAGKAVSDKS